MKIVHAAGSAPTLRPHLASESAFSGLRHRPAACHCSALLLLAGLATGLATAQPVLVEQFRQPSAELSPLDSGRGFQGPWNPTFQSLTVAPDGLSYSDTMTGIALATSGGRATNHGVGMNLLGDYRFIGFNVFPAGTEFWGSFLVRRPTDSDISGRAHITLVGHGYGQYYPPLKIGITDSQVEIVTPSGAQWAGYIDFDATALILFRAESFSGVGGGPVSVWVNPPLSGALPPPSTVLFSWNFGPYGPVSLGVEAAGGNCSLDEIRLGLSAATVLPRSRVMWPCSSGGNGHQYETVHTTDPISWEEAAAAAALRGGRLVTLTSAEENQLVFDNLVAREDVWDRRYGDLFFVDTRGPWIGASRPTYFPSPVDGWEWNGGEPWGFASWSPEGLVGIGERYASFYMGTDQATPTWRNANLAGDSRVFGYVVEYDSGITQQPQDVALVPGTTVQFSVAVDGDPMSMSFQWFRNGVPLTDGSAPHGSWIYGVTSPTLEIYPAALEDCATYSVQVGTECGEVQSNAARLKVDAINASYVDPGNCRIIRIVTSSSPMDFYTAQYEAWSRGGELISIEWQSKQAIVDVITQEPQLWQQNGLNQQVGPWIGAAFNSTMGQWYWRSGWGLNDTGFLNWAPGQPDNADGFEQFTFLTRQDESGPTQWADLAPYSPAGDTLPNSYIMEWSGPFIIPYGFETVPCGGMVIFDSVPGDHGLVGIYTWNGSDGMPVVDGVTPNGTVISGQGTPVLHISNLAQADAGTYRLYFESQCTFEAQFTILASDCAPPCPADFNQDGGIDGADVDAFFSAWESGDASADVNQDGGVDGSDIDPFFFAWENGGC
jgi:hypothetical protein